MVMKYEMGKALHVALKLPDHTVKGMGRWGEETFEELICGNVAWAGFKEIQVLEPKTVPVFPILLHQVSDLYLRCHAA